MDVVGSIVLACIQEECVIKDSLTFECVIQVMFLLPPLLFLQAQELVSSTLGNS